MAADSREAIFVDTRELWRIKLGYGAPLPCLHLLGQEQGFTEGLGGDAGDAGKQLEGVLQIRDQEVWYRCVELDGLELVSGLGSELVEGGNGEECTGAAGQD